MNHRLCTTVRRPGDKGLLNPLVHWTRPFFASFLPIPISINRVGRHASQKIFREMQFRGAGPTATGFVDSQRSSRSQSSAGFCTSYRVSFKKSAASKYRLIQASYTAVRISAHEVACTSKERLAVREPLAAINVPAGALFRELRIRSAAARGGGRSKLSPG